MISKLLIVLFVFLFSAFSVSSSESSQNDSIKNKADKLIIQFFGGATCGDCMEIKHSILFPAQKSNEEKIDLRIYDIDTDSGFNLLIKLEEDYNVKASAPITIFFPDTFLTGKEDIRKHGSRLIEYYLNNPQKWMVVSENVHLETEKIAEKLAQRFKEYSFISILVAGLIME